MDKSLAAVLPIKALKSYPIPISHRHLTLSVKREEGLWNGGN